MKRRNSIDKKIKRKKIGLIFTLLLLFVTTFLILLTKTSFFNVSEIKIIGNEQLTEDKIIMASGLTIEENIFKIDTEKMEKNLISHPYIKKTKVKRIFPNKLSIYIEERKEIAAISYIGSYIYLDNEGIVLNILSDKKDNLIVVDGLKIKNMSIGKKIMLEDNQDIDKLLNFLKDCKKNDLIKEISRINIDNKFNIKLTMNSGLNVAFGNLYNVKYKVSFLIKILEDLNKKAEKKNIILKDSTLYFTKGDDPIFKPHKNWED
ncbi:cell division protein FtsQ/DivIB [Thermohalobacter berrensis]|uniref:POTRA domain-containing protein n=1 Tax=Thermohalobacter berrensis TaxID=99594 RepID=A0A419T9Z5_9FIRM|nr:FtsQ-type POTRA domain-containing protein [Thermohalobacter berrensis]RKD34301.1 hypothetical protein BET03_00265 [Thermohalobacter berrensis]